MFQCIALHFRASGERLAGAMEDSSTETMSDGEKRKMMKDKKGGVSGWRDG